MSTMIETRLAQLEATCRHLSDREAIRDVLHRYCRGADRADLDLFKSCYWADGTDCHGFFNGNAHAFCDFVIPHLAQIKASCHSITNTLIELDGNRAFVDSQCDALHIIPVDEGKFVFQQARCHYLDVFEKRDGAWKILHRTFTVDDFLEDIRSFSHFTASFMPQPCASARVPDDLSYQRFGLLEVPIVPVDGMDLWADARQRHAAHLEKLKDVNQPLPYPISLL
jgi:hypothetical protein